MNKEVVNWVTINHKHVPIFKGESVSDAYNRVVADANEDKKQSDIAKNQAQADKLNGKEYQKLYSRREGEKFFEDNSNYKSWTNEISQKESDSINAFTNRDYWTINNCLYNKQDNEIPQVYRDQIANIQNALSKFWINKGVEVSRYCDFSIFGASNRQKLSEDDIRNFLSKTNGVVQNDGFMSFSADKEGVFLPSERKYQQLAIHLRIPPSKGAGAFVKDLSRHSEENEFLLNNKAILKFDINSLRRENRDGRIHIDAYWLGQADKRTID